MTFMSNMFRKLVFRFMGTDIQRMIIKLQGGPQPKVSSEDYIMLAPNQVKALMSMQKYAPATQVQELLELYEKVNNDCPINPATAIRVAKKSILDTPFPKKEWHR